MVRGGSSPAGQPPAHPDPPGGEGEPSAVLGVHLWVGMGHTSHPKGDAESKARLLLLPQTSKARFAFTAMS